MVNNKRYNTFVSDVLMQLRRDEPRKDKEKAKEILVEYFSKARFTVYSFVHEYFSDRKKNDGNESAMSELNCTKETVREILEQLISEFEELSCSKNDKIGRFGDEIACLNEDDNCLDCNFIRDDNEHAIYQCLYREEWYHVIRRIAKFYENLHSVDNLLGMNEAAQNMYSETVRCLKEDAREFYSEAVQGFSEKVKDISKNLENTRQELLINIISVLSIFSAVILATIVPMNLLNAISVQIFTYNWQTELTPILVFVIILFIMFNLIYFLVSYIATITFKEEYYKIFKNKRKIALKINSVILVIILILLSSVVLLKFDFF